LADSNLDEVDARGPTRCTRWFPCRFLFATVAKGLGRAREARKLEEATMGAARCRIRWVLAAGARWRQLGGRRGGKACVGRSALALERN
jgi:hypothetical protein